MGYTIARVIIIISLILLVCAVFTPIQYQDKVYKWCLLYARFITGLCLFSFIIMGLRSELGTIVLITIIVAFCIYMAIEGED